MFKRLSLAETALIGGSQNPRIFRTQNSSTNQFGLNFYCAVASVMMVGAGISATLLESVQLCNQGGLQNLFSKQGALKVLPRCALVSLGIGFSLLPKILC